VLAHESWHRCSSLEVVLQHDDPPADRLIHRTRSRAFRRRTIDASVYTGRMQDALESILDRLSADHRSALQWLAARRGRVGPRPWSRQLASEADAPAPKLTAERGIHVPSGWDVALSVALTKASKYQDGDLEPQPDGTWLLVLRAHEGADGRGLDSRWNRGLYNAWMRRVPVAVFMPMRAADYRWLGLALVEDYDDYTRTFLLHGPIEMGQSPADWGTVDPLDSGDSYPAWFAAEDAPPMETDSRRRVAGDRVVREKQGAFHDALVSAYGGRCAVTRYDALAALDAAHILPFRGGTSDTARNGILLRADIHRLFDRYLVAVDAAAMRLVVHSSLEPTKYADLDGRELHVPSSDRLTPSPAYLDLHRSRFEQRR
jgi:putative restriction endonuclease